MTHKYYELNIGSPGWAQVGDVHYYKKSKIERRVMRAIIDNDVSLKTPKEIDHLVYLRWKANRHDFGTYYDMNVAYDPYLEIELDDEFTEEQQVLSDIFWSWFNKLESYDWESEYVMELCKSVWQDDVDLTIVFKNQNEILSNDDQLRKI